MSSKWLDSVKSVIPRGFSRCYVVEILKEGPHTGKEIINRAEQDSNGKWSPSPGLIYPLLGRLLDEGIITEIRDKDKDENIEKTRNKKNIKYTLTEKGIDTVKDMHKISKGIKDQIDVMCRLGDVGRFVATDVMERISSIGYILGEYQYSTIQGKTAYRQFLINELKRIDDEQEDSDHQQKDADEKDANRKDADEQNNNSQKITIE